ncbi:hypothetical protein PR002_g4788 [Phytophthora rubi]|uniref:Uncharacterized protein n=1 Tax=Phytophthora rubi TaxID=129364 RepID=A0A6A3NAZ0_9STRA|nr:hypothetical protein PR002_g4788 [Phytophthora rubi]
MSLAAFVPTNTQKARTTAIAAFKRMLEAENVSLEFVEASILMDASGKRLAATMDRFGFYLATNEGKKARVHADYQDAALACLMWHCFGRSSDLGYVQKQHVSVSADGTFYLRLLRVKTSEEQGLTLIPDKSDFLTCPLHALAVALATQDAPGAALLAQLPDLVTEAAAPLDEGVPMQDLRQAEPASLEVAVVSTAAPFAAGGPPLSSTSVSADPPPSSWTETQTATASSPNQETQW